jgi:hypothetical protein
MNIQLMFMLLGCKYNGMMNGELFWRASWWLWNLHHDGIKIGFAYMVWFSNACEKNYYKMWVQFTSPYSPNQWIHCFFIGPHSLQLVNSLKI